MRRVLAKVAGLGAAALLATGVAACGGGNGSGGGGSGGGEREGVRANEVDIGIIADLTGPTAATQVPFVDGIRTQVAAANAEGGVNGRTINLLEEDERYDVAAGLAAYQKLVNQTPALGIIGLNNSSLQVAAIQRLARDDVPVFGAQATTKEALTPFNENFFAMQCSYADQADIAVPYMSDKVGAPGNARVASIGLDVESGYEWAELIESRTESGGGTYLGNTVLAPTASEADAQVQRIAGQNPDFIALHGSPNTTTVVLRSMEKFNIDVPVVTIFAAGGIAAYEALSPETGGLVTTVNCYTPPSIEVEGTAEMQAKASEHGFGSSAESTDFVNGYVVGQVLVDALEAAGEDPSRDSFREGLESLTDVATGGLSENVTFGPQDRAGIQTVRPYTFDYDAEQFVADGEYDDYRDQLSNEYLAEAGD